MFLECRFGGRGHGNERDVKSLPQGEDEGGNADLEGEEEWGDVDMEWSGRGC